MTNKKRRAVLSRTFRRHGFSFGDSHRAARLWFNWEHWEMADRWPTLVHYVDVMSCDCCNDYALQFTDTETLVREEV